VQKETVSCLAESLLHAGQPLDVTTTFRDTQRSALLAAALILHDITC